VGAHTRRGQLHCKARRPRQASADETPMPGISDEEIEAQIIEDSFPNKRVQLR
jgi:hypothetical protein